MWKDNRKGREGYSENIVGPVEFDDIGSFVNTFLVKLWQLLSSSFGVSPSEMSGEPVSVLSDAEPSPQEHRLVRTCGVSQILRRAVDCTLLTNVSYREVRCMCSLHTQCVRMR